jgi:hypothetical protein
MRFCTVAVFRSSAAGLTGAKAVFHTRVDRGEQHGPPDVGGKSLEDMAEAVKIVHDVLVTLIQTPDRHVFGEVSDGAVIVKFPILRNEPVLAFKLLEDIVPGGVWMLKVAWDFLSRY